MKRTYWLISRGPYPCNIGFCLTEKAFVRSWKELTDDPVETPYANPNGARAWKFQECKNDLAPSYLICLNASDNITWPEISAMIAHEAVHVCQWLWDQIGEIEPGREAEAYLVQSITREILQKLDMPKREQKTKQ